MSQRHGATLYMTLLAGWGALLARLSGQQEVVIGTPVATGRVEIEGLIGFFVNTLALRLDVSGSPSVRELMERVKEQVLAAQQHQDIPFEQVVETGAAGEESVAQSAVPGDVGLGAECGGRGLAMPGVELGALGVALEVIAKFDLTLYLAGSWRADCRRFGVCDGAVSSERRWSGIWDTCGGCWKGW